MSFRCFDGCISHCFSHPLHSAHLDARINHADTMSASSAPARVHTPPNAAMATEALMSLSRMAWMKYRPKPLMAKIDSVMTAPVNTEAMENATLTAVGIRDARQRVATDGLAAGQTLRTGGAHVIGVHLVKQVGALRQMVGDHAQNRQHDGRQDDVLPEISQSQEPVISCITGQTRHIEQAEAAGAVDEDGEHHDKQGEHGGRDDKEERAVVPNRRSCHLYWRCAV